MKEKKKLRKYPFLDTVVDVFYSIILFSVFSAFPGFGKIESFLMIFAVFVILNYWWASRSIAEVPKHYLSDLYFITVVMFIFSQWSNYFNDFKMFLVVFVIFLFFDAFYSLWNIFLHSEKEEKPLLKFFFAGEFLLGVIYLAEFFLLNELNAISLVALFLPYLSWVAINFKTGRSKSVCMLYE
ncbi:MAG: hypothetical protein QXO69_03180 [archaeon]